MILQNKQTGVLGVLEATTYHGGRPDNIIEVYEMGMGAVRVLAQYNTLEELLEEWKDYKPEGPLINGDEARRMFRLWANYVGASTFKYDAERDCLAGNYSGDPDCRLYFSFAKMWATKNLTDGAVYAVTELCGEEEE